MVSLKAVRESNSTLKTTAPGRIALFVGATSGIAMHTLLSYAHHANQPKIYIVGRSTAKLSPVIAELQKINPEGSYIPIISEISLLKNVDAACDEIKRQVQTMDLLVMCPGYVSLSKIENADGLIDPISLCYYVRMRFIHNLLPLLTAPPSARILSIHGAGNEGKLIESDLELHDHYSVMNARNHTSTMNTLALAHLTATHPTLSCLHIFPGMVVTKGYGELAEGFYAPFRWLCVYFVFPLLKMVTTTLKESGERHLFHATSARYPPREAREGGSEGLALPSGVEVAKGEDWEVGSGCYLVGPGGETVGDRKLLDEYRSRDTGKKIWEHTQEVFERVVNRD